MPVVKLAVDGLVMDGASALTKSKDWVDDAEVVRRRQRDGIAPTGGRLGGAADGGRARRSGCEDQPGRKRSALGDGGR